ncbi:MAG: hypothetical protein PHV99_03850 [Candidatus Pacebacteria bacterium]|nr:hypothetical protein [Candidatus Paceibacterota bacterium]
MEEEKKLPVGEPGIEVTALPVLQTPAEPLSSPTPLSGEEVVTKSEVIQGVPSPKQQQWGVVISIVVIVLMIIVGAFYAWGERIAENQYPAAVTQ